MAAASAVSVLYREPKLLKGAAHRTPDKRAHRVSVLYREPKLLKEYTTNAGSNNKATGFSALP